MVSKKSMVTDLTSGNVFTQLIRFAVPLLMANLLQMVYNIVDMVVVGQFVGSAGISAVANGGDIMMLFTSFSMGLCSAGQVIISQYIGKNEKEFVNRTIGTMLSFMIIFAAILTVVALSVSKWCLNVIKAPAEAYDMALDYLTVCFLGLIFIFGYNAVSSILRGMGDGKRPLIFIAIATIVNIVLDLLLIAVFDMGAMGAALATVIGQGVSFIFSIFYLYKHKEAFGFDFKPASFRIDTKALVMLVKLGMPMALQQIAVCISGLVVNTLINGYGVIASAVSGIGTKLRMIIAILSSAVGTAASTMIGQNVGAGRYDRVNKVFACSFWFLLVVCTVLGGIGLIFPEAVFGIFDTNPEVLAMAPRYMVINFVTYFLFAFMQPGVSLINGIGNAGMSLFMGIMDGVVARIGLVLLMGVVLDLGVWGVWWGATFAALMTMIIAMGYYISGKWKTYKPIIND